MTDRYLPTVPSQFERHAQTMIGGVMFAVLCWVGVTLLDVRDRLARIEERQLAGSEREKEVDARIRDLEQRLRALERK